MRDQTARGVLPVGATEVDQSGEGRHAGLRLAVTRAIARLKLRASSHSAAERVMRSRWMRLSEFAIQNQAHEAGERLADEALMWRDATRSWGALGGVASPPLIGFTHAALREGCPLWFAFYGLPPCCRRS